MRKYELTYIVHPHVDAEGLSALNETVKGLIENQGGTVERQDVWGLRRLAYPIKKEREGQYVFVAFALEPRGLVELERSLRLKESVLRYLIVCTDED